MSCHIIFALLYPSANKTRNLRFLSKIPFSLFFCLGWTRECGCLLRVQLGRVSCSIGSLGITTFPIEKHCSSQITTSQLGIPLLISPEKKIFRANFQFFIFPPQEVGLGTDIDSYRSLLGPHRIPLFVELNLGHLGQFIDFANCNDRC